MALKFCICCFIKINKTELARNELNSVLVVLWVEDLEYTIDLFNLWDLNYPVLPSYATTFITVSMFTILNPLPSATGSSSI